MKNSAVKVVVDYKTSNELVVLHEPLVKRIAYHLMSRLPASVQADDLIQAGMIGLIEASRKFDPEQGASFETYAGIRIRGAMLDEIRRTDWTPRSVHRKAREVAEAVRKIENEKGRDARGVEVAEVMGLELAAYHKILQDATGCRIFSFEDPGTLSEENYAQNARQPNQPFDNLQNNDFKKGLADAIKGLPERERLVMALYYDEELNLREIGDILGVSESRVCQIHGQALIRLRARMESWLTD
ncbi:MAG: RNA polymerase sigma factor FliA [Gammaproteobacteria bacterium]|nr:RNA polymerase sigma factor FliA [Gammaproteobacteria bacterium]